VAQATDQDQDLWELRAEYGRRYRIWCSGGGFKASRNALDPRVMTAGAADELRAVLSADRQAWAAESRPR
jgi:hypothetical protein